MTPRYTTHLICVPELESAAIVSGLHILPGHHVDSNTLLLTLNHNGAMIEICAPEAGLVSHLMVTTAESVSCGDLLLQMEIEEAPLQFAGLPEEEPAFVSACLQDWPQDHPALLSVTPAAARLAARLGVDLSCINSRQHPVETADIEAYVRSVMLQWQNRPS
ncbi:MAG: biotin/lipoyl-containing protein [Iodobacter sp.]